LALDWLQPAFSEPGFPITCSPHSRFVFTRNKHNKHTTPPANVTLFPIYKQRKGGRNKYFKTFKKSSPVPLCVTSSQYPLLRQQRQRFHPAPRFAAPIALSFLINHIDIKE
jgi:hypothetical protein